MSVIGTIEITHSVECKACGFEARGGTLKAAYMRLVLHLRLCEDTAMKRLSEGEQPQGIWETVKMLWALWRWKQR